MESCDGGRPKGVGKDVARNEGGEMVDQGLEGFGGQYKEFILDMGLMS